jgi:MFS family permease
MRDGDGQRINALALPDFRMLLVGRLARALGARMLAVGIGWELYERTRDPLVLGIVGLVQIIPVVGLSLFGGQFADRYNRKQVIAAAGVIALVASALLIWLSLTTGPVEGFYVGLFLIGVANAFGNPASSAMLGQTVPASYYENAAAWGSSSWQIAGIVGPIVGGWLIGITGGAAITYSINFVGVLIMMISVFFIRGRQELSASGEPMLQAIRAGLAFIWDTKVLLGAISLDMLAVLFGGATALLPIYARDILMVGPEGLGLMEAAPALGAIVMGVLLANRPPFLRAGRALLWSVVAFGVATIIFGISTSFPLSLLALFSLGAFDNVSVVVREALVLSRTPDAMRGRVSAVNGIFIGLSNELGSFESGFVASFIGPVRTAALGGVATILIVGLIARVFPDLRRLGRLTAHPQPTAEEPAVV